MLFFIMTYLFNSSAWRWNTVCHESEKLGEVESHLLDVLPLVASAPFNIEYKREPDYILNWNILEK